MKHKIVALLLFVAIFAGANAQTFTLKSNDLGGQFTKKQEFAGFGCTGENISPQLSWANAPQGTKSFAITVFDPDAPTGSGFWHWVVFDIPTTINELKTGAGDVSKGLAPKGCIQSITSFGGKGFGGACPPVGHGLHQYIFTVHALKTDKLTLDENTNPALVGYYLWQNTLAKASVVTYYGR
ncbi:MAG: YbhB/YbcL family Raf kinase inhibitor-like protein [Verrucomicrobia bacterium]|nr:YbhB/YbcL family Raf kinase inhibitor-like protein [Cytophagales bacterium]